MNPLFTLEYTILATVILAAAGGLLAWRSTVKCVPGVRVLMTCLRVLAIVCLGLIALNIGRWEYERAGKELEWAVLVDRSQSMTTADSGGKPRWDEAKRIAGVIKTVAGDTIQTRCFTFTDRLETVPGDDVAQLKADGAATDIIQAGRNVLGRYRSGDKKLAGIILVSDGKQVGAGRESDLAIECRSQESPIYAMPVGGTVTRKDVSITEARKQYVSFLGQKLKIGAVVKNEGLGDISTDVILLDASGVELARQKVEVVDGGNAQVQFEVIPARLGYHEYTMKVPDWPGDNNGNNNSAVTGVAVLKDKIRVLVAEGTPGWDSKFIVQLLRAQANMDVTSVYRLSTDRFFTVETDSAKDTEAKEAVFPDSAGQMALSDILVLGKGAEYFLNADRIRLMGDFVREQGGCLIYARGKPYSGTLDELAPLEPVSWGESISTPFSFQPTRAGENAGLFGELLPGVKEPLWKNLPQLQVANRCASLKGFSQVLVEGVFQSAGRGVSFPLIVSRRYGKGVIVVVNAEGLWRWDFFPSSSDASRIYKEFWSQLLQWGVTYSEFLPGQEYSLRLSESAVLPDTPVYVRMSRRGGGRTATAPRVSVLLGDKTIQELPGIATADSENRWNAVLSFSNPGTYRVKLADTNTAGGGPCAVLQVRKPPEETDDLCADPAFLKRIAEDAGGGLATESELAKILKPAEKVIVATDLSKAVWVPAWDRGWFLVVILLCFSIEWFVRRRNGLM